MWIFWIVVANIGIFLIEYSYRVGTYNSFFTALPYITIPILVSQLGLFYGFRQAPSLLLAGALFTVINIFLRVINTYRLGETINIYNWSGIALLIVATFLLKVK